MKSLYTELTASQKIRYGNTALIEYQNLMKDKFGNNYPHSIDTLFNLVSKRENDFISRLGEGVGSNIKRLTQRRLTEALERVVEKSGPNKIPRISVFIDGICEELTSWDFSLFGDASIEMAKDVLSVSKKTGKVIADVSEGVGDSITFFSRNLKWILLIGIGLIAIIGFGVVRKKAV